MNVTFSSSNKKTIQCVVNYLYSIRFTADNIADHIGYIQSRYKVSTVIHEPPPTTRLTPKRTTMKIIMDY
jgi:hypothetical protein